MTVDTGAPIGESALSGTLPAWLRTERKIDRLTATAETARRRHLLEGDSLDTTQRMLTAATMLQTAIAAGCLLAHWASGPAAAGLLVSLVAVPAAAALGATWLPAALTGVELSVGAAAGAVIVTMTVGATLTAGLHLLLNPAGRARTHLLQALELEGLAVRLEAGRATLSTAEVLALRAVHQRALNQP